MSVRRHAIPHARQAEANSQQRLDPAQRLPRLRASISGIEAEALAAPRGAPSWWTSAGAGAVMLEGRPPGLADFPSRA